MKFLNNILHWASGMGRVFRNEFRLILGDVGVMLFFFAFRWPILWCTPSYTTPR